MKKPFFLFLANFLWIVSFTQNYWQQKLAYTIDATLNTNDLSLEGFEKLVYTNHSPDTLTFIWFHLWPNAYKNDKTAFSEQMLQNGDTRFYFALEEQRGYINRLNFKVDGTTAKTEDHLEHIDIIKVLLPQPLLPNRFITITTPFHVKLPHNFSRGGYDGESFQLTHWYPKPAVYDSEGWHPLPYLQQGEFYSEFGSYDVRLTLPADYVVAATGVLQNRDEIDWLQQRALYLPGPQPAQKKKHFGSSKKRKKDTASHPTSTADTQTKTLRYLQDSIHDFALFANKQFIVDSDTIKLLSGRTITVATFYTPEHKENWKNSLRYLKEALHFYSNEVGEYPYTVASVVQGPESINGGMEYPTISLISPTPSAEDLDATIAHEAGHNWFYGILATNERKHPWLDEGLNTFYEKKYRELKYGKQTKEAEVFFQLKATSKTDQPIATLSQDLSPVNYNLSAYHKTAEWLKGIEEKIGKEVFREVIQHYYQQWRFKHPQPDNFKQSVENILGIATEKTWNQLYIKGVLPHNRLKGTTFVSLLKKGSFKAFFQSPTKNIVLVSPAIGFNVYDKMQIGALVTNYGSPVTRFHFLVTPLFATGSKSFTGLGKINYAIRSESFFRKTDIFINAASFGMDDFLNEEGSRNQLRFTKLVPGFRFTLKEKSPRSTVTKYIQWKTFLFREQRLQISIDSPVHSTDTVMRYQYATTKKDRFLNQLQVVYSNDRALYPFSATLQVEQAQHFIRTSFTGHYFFNYASGGGLAIRFFAGNFSYLNGSSAEKEFATDRFHLNLSGPKGYEDYTYSNYFVGRNLFYGLPSHQIMLRDGAFKVRTDMLAQKIGKTDNWLSAINFVSTVPDKINPFSVLPVKIPMKIFADVGTYAEGWDRSKNLDRFLFNAGLQFSFLQERLNIYVPLLFSKVYRNYIQSTVSKSRLLKTISFSINLYTSDVKKLTQELDF